MSARAPTERQLWTALVQSEAKLARAGPEDCLVHHYANCDIRCALRDRFGLNLDDLSTDGAQVLDGFFRKRMVKEAREKKLEKERGPFSKAVRKMLDVLEDPASTEAQKKRALASVGKLSLSSTR